MSIHSLASFFTRTFSPRSLNEDMARREFILNVLLVGILTLLFIGVVIDVFDRFFADPLSYKENSLPSLVIYGLFLFFLFLYMLSRRRFIRTASYLLLGTFFLLTAYIGYAWGIDVPAQIVFYPLVIVMAGILISTRVAFVTTLLIVGTMLTTGYLQVSGTVTPNQYWKAQLWTWTDVIMISVMYLIVASISWLSNREIEKSLRRARQSERALKDERDSLELRVSARTAELRKLEVERMSQTYHLVEFGRLAGGIFHDLMSPLTGLALNIERIAAVPEARTMLSADIGRAKQAAAHMQQLMESMRKHLAHEGESETFSVTRSLEELVQILSSYARAHTVRISLVSSGILPLYGDPVAFTQIMTNLITNAIQSHPTVARGTDAGVRQVEIVARNEEGNISIVVKDTGSGIPPETLPHIFEPFFTTKSPSKGMGLGLSLAKRIIEKKFNGTIAVNSVLGKGSVFTVYLPVREP